MTALTGTLQNSAIFSRSDEGHFPLRAANQDVRLDTDLPEQPNGMLSRFGFQLGCRFQIRNQCQMNVQTIFLANIQRELPNRFQERLAFNVTDRPADLGNHDIDVLAGELADATFDLVGDVRNHLHRFAKKLAATLLFDHFQVDLPGRVI